MAKTRVVIWRLMTPHSLQVGMNACSIEWAAELLPCKSMQKQFASFNTFVSRQTLSYSSCDGLCTDQNDTAVYVHLGDDIAVVCSKLSPTSHHSHLLRNQCRARRGAECECTANAVRFQHLTNNPSNQLYKQSISSASTPSSETFIKTLQRCFKQSQHKCRLDPTDRRAVRINTCTK